MSPCHFQQNSGDTRVEVSIKNIKIIYDNDKGSNPADLNLWVVLYSGDFTQATNDQAERVIISSGSQWPEDKLPAPLTMCANSRVPVIATVQGWVDEGTAMPA
jgi:hypothetical protein